MGRAELSAILIVSALTFSLFVSFEPQTDPGVARSSNSGPQYWGVTETFSNATTGTHGPSMVNDAAIYGLTDPWSNFTADAVVLDNWLYVMTAADAQGTVLLYQPSGPSERTDDWNLSLEVTRTKEASFYESVSLSTQAGRQSMFVYLLNETDGIQTGVCLVTGSPGYEGIQLYDAVGMTWTNLTQDMRPAFTHDSEAFGLRPDRYVVAFAHTNNSSEITVTITNTGSGVAFSGNITVPSTVNIQWPKLRADMDVDTGTVGVYPVATGWILDNLMFRSLESRHPITEPAYEFVEASDPVWISVTDISGTVLADATVEIEGNPAAFNPTTSRYEASISRDVDWDSVFNYTVIADGVHISDSVDVTTTMDPLEGVEISRWWNGWDWVSVFGRDDSSDATSADMTYNAFDHPTTSYMTSGFTGDSNDTLKEQSEIALHYPHEYRTWGHKSWSDAMVSAEAGQAMLDEKYYFASRWDDPRYVGIGDMYISMANPGNTASWEMMFAQFQTGTRIMGTSSWTYLGGNSSLMGSYWINVPTGSWIPSWGSWHPYQKMDMMDMLRSVNTDSDSVYHFPTIQLTAENHGVVRFYNHNIISNGSLLRWVVDEKTDFPYENWKATDGEVASYINGRWSTDVKLNSSSSDELWIYDVTRQDPISSGYWRVPVTLSFDMTDCELSYVRTVEGPWNLNSSDGSLQNLDGAREMDVGYEVRGDRLYVSYFWNETTRLEIKVVHQKNPRIISEAEPYGYSYMEYSTTINCTAPDNGASVWSLNTNAAWLGIESSNDTTCQVSGTTPDWGVYFVNLTVSDGDNSDYLNWSLTVTRLKTISGRVLNETNGPIEGLLVTVTIKDGPAVRSVVANTTDASGIYTVTLINDQWFLDDAIIVSATYESRTEDNSTLASTDLSQVIDLQFVPMIPEFDVVRVAVVVAVVAALVTAVAMVWKRKRSLRNS